MYSKNVKVLLTPSKNATVKVTIQTKTLKRDAFQGSSFNFWVNSSKFYTRAAPDVCHKFQVCFICYFGCQQSTSQRRVGLMPHQWKVEHANGGL